MGGSSRPSTVWLRTVGARDHLAGIIILATDSDMRRQNGFHRQGTDHGLTIWRDLKECFARDAFHGGFVFDRDLALCGAVRAIDCHHHD